MAGNALTTRQWTVVKWMPHLEYAWIKNTQIFCVQNSVDYAIKVTYLTSNRNFSASSVVQLRINSRHVPIYLHEILFDAFMSITFLCIKTFR
jgi:hypothetical protein